MPEELALIPSLNLKSIEIETIKLSFEKVVKKLLHIVDQLASFQVVVKVRTDEFLCTNPIDFAELCGMHMQNHPHYASTDESLNTLKKTFRLEVLAKPDPYQVYYFHHLNENSRKKLVIITKKAA